MFVATVTAWIRKQPKSPGAGCNRPKGAAGTGHRLSEADVVKLLQSRANWSSCRVLHYCTVDLVVLKVRLSPGSDRIADDSADPGCATSGLVSGFGTNINWNDFSVVSFDHFVGEGEQ